jgi:hypothetical protein
MVDCLIVAISQLISELLTGGCTLSQALHVDAYCGMGPGASSGPVSHFFPLAFFFFKYSFANITIFYFVFMMM